MNNRKNSHKFIDILNYIILFDIDVIAYLIPPHIELLRQRQYVLNLEELNYAERKLKIQNSKKSVNSSAKVPNEVKSDSQTENDKVVIDIAEDEDIERNKRIDFLQIKRNSVLIDF